MTKSKHTPTPWEIEGGRIITRAKWHSMRQGSDHERDRVYQGIASMADRPNISNEEAKANAEFIVKAVNAFYPLVEALEAVVNMYVSLAESGDAGFIESEENQEIIKARAALSLAKGDRDESI